MSLMFEQEAGFPDNRPRANFIFLGFPFRAPLSLDDYKGVIRGLEQEYPIRFWHFLEEYTTNELMRKLWRGILKADLCIFDISGGNPNVAFELGLALARFKRCSVIHKNGEPNPLGSADIAYAERTEYSSVITLKDALKRIVESKSTAARKVREASSYLYDSSRPQYTAPIIEGHIRTILSEIFLHSKITKQRAEQLIGDRQLADKALNHLRGSGILKLEGERRGAKWIFAEEWVTKTHEVAAT